MYEAHFGLTTRPFAETVDPDAFVSLPSRDAVARRLRYALEHARGPALAFGPVGMGKTLLARKVARDLAQPTVHLTFTAMPAEELVIHLADELTQTAAGPPASGLAGALRYLRASLAEHVAQDRRPLLVVDEAQAIDDPAAFEVLRLLLNFATNGEPDLSLLLVGGTELLLRMPRALTDRLMAQAVVEPFAPEESRAYIEGRLARAGASVPLFDGDALRQLHLAAGGRPRQLNRLADMALLIAYARGHRTATLDAVAIAQREAA